MLKLTGLLFIVSFFSLFGVYLAGAVRARGRALERAQLFLHMLCERISYTRSPLDEIFDCLSREPLLSQLDFIPGCHTRLLAGEAFPKAFSGSVEQCRCPLNARDREIINGLSAILGASDAESQLSGLSLIKASLALEAEHAREEGGRRAKLYSSLGVLTGLAAAVVML